MAASDSPFVFAAPPGDRFLSPFSPLALLASAASPDALSLRDLAGSLLVLRTTAAYKREIGALSGELRDEWRGRVAGVKGDWMARIIADPTEGMDDDDNAEPETAREVKPPVEGAKGELRAISEKDRPSFSSEQPAGRGESTPIPPMIPTIISDHDSLQDMSTRVDSLVEAEFKQHMDEAEGRLRGAVLRHEKMELEVFLGGLVLQALEVADSDEAEASEMVADNLQDTLGELGWDGVPLEFDPVWEVAEQS